MYVSHAPRRRAASPLARLRERLARLIRQPAADGVGGSPSTGHGEGDVTRDPGRCLDLMRSHEHPPTDRRVRGISRDPTTGVTATVLAEAERGYDLLAIGASRRGPGGSEPLFSTDVDDIVGGSPCPVLVVTAGTLDPETTILAEGSYDRVLLPTVGTEYSRHAAEIAFTIARNADAIVEVVNVVERTGDVTAPDDGAAVEIGRQIVAREADLGRQVGATVRTRVVRSDRPGVEILDLAAAQDADLIVMGTNVRPLSGKAFLGHRVEHVVTHADCPVAVVTST